MRALIKAVLPAFAVRILSGLKARIWEEAESRAYRKHPTIPPPHFIKYRAIADLGRRFGARILVETGTYQGEMTWRCRNLFSRIYTIELGHGLAVKAAERFSNLPHIEVIEGDSTHVLPEVLRQIDERAIFWLDGHYSAGITALGAKPTPLTEELTALKNQPIDNHVILIDDARLFGDGGYPTIDEVTKMLLSINPRYEIAVVDDMVQCLPPGGPRRSR